MNESNIESIWIGVGDSCKGYSITPAYGAQSKCDAIGTCFFNGHMAEILWFTILINGEIVTKVNSTFVSEIIYKKTPCHDDRSK